MIRQLKYLKWWEWLMVVLIMGLLVCQVICNLYLPEAMAEIGQLLYASADMSQIWMVGLKMLGYVFGVLICTIGVSFLSSIVITNLMARVRQKVFVKVNDFSMGEINHFSIASLITRSTNDITQLQQVFSLILTFGITAPLTAVLAIIKVVNLSSSLSYVNVVSVLVLIALVSIIMLIAVPKFKKIQKITDQVNLVTRENLTGLKVVRAYSAEKFQEAKFEKVNDHLTRTERFVQRVMALIDPGMTLVMSGTSLAIVWLTAYISGNDPTAIVNMGEFTQYSVQIIFSFLALSMIFMFVPRGIVSAKRINEILKTESSLLDGEGNIIPEEKGTIVFDNVSFRYPGADECVLKNISFTVKQGQTIAFIGSTGSGKSTLINLIPRFYDVTEGNIYVDGINVKDYKLHDLHDKIGYVPQKGSLFRGTVTENIRYGNENATIEQVKEALDISQANFVYELDGGLDYQISQGGKNVSGGQRQRLSIARAIVKNPEIFIFDDSFSALDYKTDKTLRMKLNKKTKNVTKVIVAQRIGTIMNADQIIVLDEGNMVGKGKHKDLLKNCQVYKEIALSQLSEEELKK